MKSPSGQRGYPGRPPKVLCFCGFAFNGKKCKELRKKHPTLNNYFWHHPSEDEDWMKTWKGRSDDLG